MSRYHPAYSYPPPPPPHRGSAVVRWALVAALVAVLVLVRVHGAGA